jgi:hypothetical protein
MILKNKPIEEIIEFMNVTAEEIDEIKKTL